MTAHKASLIFLIALFILSARSVIPDDHIWIRDIPTDRTTWVVCCKHDDCREAERIRVKWLSDTLSEVTVDGYKPFIMNNKNIHNSTNGKVYTCRVDVSKPPASGNIQCVFRGTSFS